MDERCQHLWQSVAKPRRGLICFYCGKFKPAFVAAAFPGGCIDAYDDVITPDGWPIASEPSMTRLNPVPIRLPYFPGRSLVDNPEPERVYCSGCEVCQPESKASNRKLRWDEWRRKYGSRGSAWKHKTWHETLMDVLECSATYAEWAAQYGLSSSRKMKCCLEAGHDGPHKWKPITEPERPDWTRPEQFGRQNE